MKTLKYLDYIRKKNYVPRIKQKKKKADKTFYPFGPSQSLQDSSLSMSWSLGKKEFTFAKKILLD